MLYVYNSDTLMYQKPYDVAKRLNLRVDVVLSSYVDKVSNFMYEINIFNFKKSLEDGTFPVYDLIFSRNDLLHFTNLSEYSASLGYLDSSQNTWRDATLRYNDEEYKVKVKLHGDTTDNWSYEKRSYRVKLREDSIKNMTIFNLIIYEKRTIAPYVTDIMNEEFNLGFGFIGEYATLRINGVVQGLYYVQEKAGEDYLERNRCSNCEIIKNRDNWYEDHPRSGNKDPYGIFDGPGHTTAFDYEFTNIDLDETSLNKEQVLYRAKELYETIEKRDSDSLLNFFDLDYISSFEALRLLSGDAHIIVGDNLKMVYRATNGKFYPLSRDNMLVYPLSLEMGGVESSLNKYHWTSRVILGELLSRNDIIRYHRNKKAHDFILNRGDYLLGNASAMLEKVVPYSSSVKPNTRSVRRVNYDAYKIQRNLKKNMRIVREMLEYSKVYAGATLAGNRISLEIIPDSIAEVKVSNLVVETQGYEGKVVLSASNKSFQGSFSGKTLNLTNLTSKLYFSAGLNENMHPKKHKYDVQITFLGNNVKLNNLTITFVNGISGKPVLPHDTYFHLTRTKKHYDNSKQVTIEKFVSNHPHLSFSYDNGVLKLNKGKYTISEDIIVPEYNAFEIEKGTTLLLAPNVSIISYSPILINATPQNPVTVTNLRNHPFGTLGVVGDDECLTYIKGLVISGGREDYVNGIYFSGALSVHHSDLTITESVIRSNHADDGLNLKYGRITADNCVFENNFADQFDCDFCVGTIKNSFFCETIPGDDNGDGLDFSGSKVIVRNNSFINFNDKGLSVGEDTQVFLFGNTISDNNYGVCVKDKSDIFAVSNTFNGNNVSIYSYVKKPLFGAPTTYLYDNTFRNTNEAVVTRDGSKMFEMSINDLNTFLLPVKNDNITRLYKSLNKYFEYARGIEDENK